MSKDYNIVAGIDIGNATTEAAIGKVYENNKIEFISSAVVKTTGIKGTQDNIKGIFNSLSNAIKNTPYSLKDLSLIGINEAAPVIGDVAMETITETIITESTMIGHNPSTPGGEGIGVGYTFMIEETLNTQEDVIVIIPSNVEFDLAAKLINKNMSNGVRITGAIVQRDDGVLINNRLDNKIPIVDEVSLIHKIPLNMKAAVEVAANGKVIEMLSNPYGVATLFQLNSKETKHIVPITRALIGNRSAVVIKTPKGDVKEKRIPAGVIYIDGHKKKARVDVDMGADKLMGAVNNCYPIEDIKGEAGTNAGGMIEKVRQVMANLTEKTSKEIKIQDLLAIDTFIPQKVRGALANEFSLENAVGIAAMVKSDKLQMNKIAIKLKNELGVQTKVGGIEADMAILGALTTPGCAKPLAIIDMGAGSTDASIIDKNGKIQSIHLAGAGNMVTMIINTELGLEDMNLAEDIKKYPLGKVETLFNIRHEDGTVEFFQKPIDPRFFSRIVILKDNDMIPIKINASMERIIAVRREAKIKVFVTNALRSLSIVAPTGSIRDIEYVVLVGGSALDFEIPGLVTDALSRFNIVAGRGNIRGTQGPRNAVATGLVITIGGKYSGR